MIINCLLLAAPRWEDEYFHAVPFMAKEPRVSLKDQQSGETLKIPWDEIVHKHVRTNIRDRFILLCYFLSDTPLKLQVRDEPKINNVCSNR
jgi:hypothetical protein